MGRNSLTLPERIAALAENFLPELELPRIDTFLQVRVGTKREA
jgi:hypothetical protein